MKRHLPLSRNRHGDRHKNVLFLSFCPHLSASKVEEASRLLPLQEQRRDAAATLSVFPAVNSCPESFRGGKP